MKTYEKPQVQVLNLTADTAMAVGGIVIGQGDNIVSDTTEITEDSQG